MVLTYEADCVTARLSGRISPDLIRGLDQLLSCYEPGYWHTWAYIHGRSDGKTHFFQRPALTFPAGLGPRVEGHLKGLHVPLEILDERLAPGWDPTHVPELHGVTLDPDQVEATRVLLAAGRGCAVLPTNFGKTEVAAAIFRAAGLQRCLFLVDRRSLLLQTAERMTLRLREKIGMVGSGYRDLRRRVTIATVQALAANLPLYRDRLFANQRVLVVDECHTIAHSALTVLRHIPAPVRLGLSATIRESQRRMFIEAGLGPIVLERDLHELMETGRAATPEIIMVRVGGVFADTLPFDALYEQAIVQNAVRNALIAEIVRREINEHRPTLVLVWSIEHGQILQGLLSNRFHRVPFLYGKTPPDEIQKAKAGFASGIYPVLVASTIFDFGQDMPEIRTLICGAGMKSALRTIQRLGRALRKKSTGENRARVIDFFDMGSPMLMRQARARSATYTKKGFPALVVGADAIP